MILDWKTTLVIGCLLVQVSGQEFQRFNSEPNHPIDVHRPNSIQIEGRDYREISDKSIELNYIDGTGKKILIPSAAENSHELGNEDEKLLEVIVSKDYDVSTPWEIERFDRIGERMIARANITEDAKRVVRQVKKQRPGFFWTLARVAFETVNETRSAIQQISALVEGNFGPETTTPRGGTTTAQTTSTTTTQRPTTTSSDSTDETVTTTEEPYKLTRSGLEGIVRRNLRGLIRLFNIEWRDAVNQSQANVREFQRDLSNRISPFLQDNPDIV